MKFLFKKLSKEFMLVLSNVLGTVLIKYCAELKKHLNFKKSF